MSFSEQVLIDNLKKIPVDRLEKLVKYHEDTAALIKEIIKFKQEPEAA